MPFKSLKNCSKSGCPCLTHNRFCPEHTKQDTERYEKQRGSASERGYTARWHKTSRRYLDEHPLCVECAKEGHDRGATVTDHIEPHKGDMEKFWNEENWQPLCRPHHDAKTLREGRWGR